MGSAANVMVSAEELGVPTPMTRCFGDLAEADETQIRQLECPFYLIVLAQITGTLPG